MKGARLWLHMATKPMDFNESFQASAAKLEDANEVKRTVKTLSKCGASLIALLKIAKEAEIEAKKS